MVFAFLLVPDGRAWAVTGNWTSHLYMNDIRDLVVTSEGVWCATNGGVLLFDFDRADFRTWHRTGDELSSDSLVSVTALEDGSIAFGTQQEGVSVVDPASGIWFNHTSLMASEWPMATNEILFLREDPPWRLIGSVGGVFALRDGDLQLGCEEGIDPCGLPSWDVSAGIHHDGALWFGTRSRKAEGDAGVARYSFATGEWEILTDGFPTQGSHFADATGLVMWQDRIYCATVQGIVVWNEDAWENADAGLEGMGQVRDLYAGDQRLLAALTGVSGGVYVLNAGEESWERLGGTQEIEASCVAEGPDGIVWAGATSTWDGAALQHYDAFGLWEYAEGEWTQHLHNGPHLVQTYPALTVDDQDRLWAAAQERGRGWRLVVREAGLWSVHNHLNSPLTNAWVFDLRVEEDQVWVGHCCCNDLSDLCRLDHWEYGEETITVLDDAFNIWDSARDGWGNLWFASNHGSPDEHPDVVQGLFRWNRASQTIETFGVEETGGQLRSNAIAALLADGSDLWIGYASNGLSLCRLGSDGRPSTTPSGWSHFDAEGGDLIGDRITALAGGSDQLWVGTDLGLSLWEDSEWSAFGQSTWGLPGIQISDIALTEDGAAWIAIRDQGVTRMAREITGGWTYETQTTPDLVNADALTLAVGAGGRDLWVGTSRGISHYVPQQLPDSTRFEEVHVFPNPLNPACGVAAQFVALPGKATEGVVVDVAGQVVGRFSGIFEQEPFWDGTDLDGNPVAPGLYVVRVSTPQGWLTGQIAVLDLVPCE